jgi:hypothetical protein
MLYEMDVGNQAACPGLRLVLTSKPSYEVQDDGQHYAEQDRSDKREIDSRILAAIDDVPGKTPDGDMDAPAQHQHKPEDDQYTAEPHQ